jgi:hypothetical protein
MNTFGLLPLQESMVQRGAGKHNQFQLYITVLMVDYRILKSLSILTAVVPPMIKYIVDQLLNCFRQETMRMLAIH